jgi:hypothetical protein
MEARGFTTSGRRAMSAHSSLAITVRILAPTSLAPDRRRLSVVPLLAWIQGQPLRLSSIRGNRIIGWM